MKPLYFIALALTVYLPVMALPAPAALSAPLAPPVLPAKPKDTVAKKYTLQYDPTKLRIPGATLPIGIVTQSGTSPATRTKGFLKGKDGWSKLRIDVQGGSASNGKIRFAADSTYKKGDSITVNVYTRKWLLGGKGKFLFTQKIPYDYEDSINVVTTGNIGRAPGDHVQFGVRTWFDNKTFTDTWFPAKKNAQTFLFDFDGGHLSKKKGDLKIDEDPKKIHNDRVQLIASLTKDSAIKDTLQIMLDYVANYQCKIPSKGRGHDLYVAADVYFDSLIDASLMKIRVTDSTAHKIYRYRINTKGGSLSMYSKGADGADGNNGLDGMSGSDGSSGTISTDVETTTNPDGTTSTTTTTTQGPGGNGGNGTDGDNGGDGDNGSDGGNIIITYSATAAPFLNLIKALSIPGAGGSGGRGGQGGHGGNGGDGTPSGASGVSGFDGHAGSDGANGKPGKITFVPKT